MSASPGYRWVVLLMCWAAFTMTSVDRSTWGPAAASVSDSLAVPLAAIGIFATCYYIGYVVSNAFGGFLADWIGGRAMLSTTMLVAGSFMIVFGSTTSITTGLIVQGAVGFFAGADYSAGLKLIATWFRPSEYGLAMGIFLTATSLGTLIANAAVPRMIIASGWQEPYRVFGSVTIVIALLCLILVRNGQPDQVPPERSAPNLRPLLQNRDLILLGIAGFGGLWGTYGFITWSNTLMTRGSNIDPVDAGVVLVIFAGVALVTKPLIGWSTDKLGIGRKLPIVAILLLFGVTLLVFGRLDTYTQFLWCAPILGIGAYAYSPLTAAITPVLTGTQLVGSAAGGVNAVWQLGSVLVPAVVGPVFSATGSFYSAFVVLAIGPLVGAVVMIGVNENRHVTSDLSPENESARV
ncbi:MFS transporter [Rhodococcus marinonascens]|uniref:MFS transporter n=1 Tax=Rhodococcus marinonascens TaxID=38311 RepID=UPI00093437BD|nr:MFS transporter [Rhodococcus marinonascens]